MSTQDTSSVGGPLDAIRRDLMKIPPAVFASYLQNPDNTPNGGVAFSLLVGLEAARRQKIEEDRKRQEQPDPSRIPTIAEELRAGQMRDMEGVPTYKTGIAASAQPAAAPPAAPAPAPVAAAPTPAPAPAPVAMAGPPVRMAHGGIIAFSGGGMPKQEPGESFEDFRRRVFEEELARQQEKNEEKAAASEKERLRRLALRPSNLGMGRPFAPLVSEVTDKPVDYDTPYPEPASIRGGARAGVASLLQDAPRNVATPAPAPAPAYAPTRDTSELDQSLLADGVTDPAIRAALVQSMRADAAAGKQFSYKPQAAPITPSAASPIPAPPVSNKAFEDALGMIGTRADFTPEKAAAAQAKALAERSGVIDPRMAEIRRLQAEAEGIGSRRDEGALGRALMQFGLRTMQGGSRPGTAGSAVAGAGLEALGSYEKEQTGMIERALKANQIKIELEKELMKQGVDSLTAGRLAEKEARDFAFKTAEEGREVGSKMASALVQKQQADTALERAYNQLTIAEGRLRELVNKNATDAEINRARMERDYLLYELRKLSGVREDIAEKRKTLQAEAKILEGDFRPEARARLTGIRAQLAALDTGGGAAGDSSKGWEIKPKQ